MKATAVSTNPDRIAVSSSAPSGAARADESRSDCRSDASREIQESWFCGLRDLRRSYRRLPRFATHAHRLQIGLKAVRLGFHEDLTSGRHRHDPVRAEIAEVAAQP